MVLHVVNPDPPPTLPSLPPTTSLLADESSRTVHARPPRGSTVPPGHMPRRTGAVKVHRIRRQSWTDTGSAPPHLHIDIPSSTSKAVPAPAELDGSVSTKTPVLRRHSDPPTGDPWTDDQDGLLGSSGDNDGEGFKEAVSSVSSVPIPSPLHVKHVSPISVPALRPTPYRPYTTPRQQQQQQQQQSAPKISPLIPRALNVSAPFTYTPPPRPSSLARAPGIATRPPAAPRHPSSPSTSSSASMTRPASQQQKQQQHKHDHHSHRPPLPLRIKTPPVAQSALSTLLSPSPSPPLPTSTPLSNPHPHTSTELPANPLTQPHRQPQQKKPQPEPSPHPQPTPTLNLSSPFFPPEQLDHSPAFLPERRAPHPTPPEQPHPQSHLTPVLSAARIPSTHSSISPAEPAQKLSNSTQSPSGPSPQSHLPYPAVKNDTKTTATELEANLSPNQSPSQSRGQSQRLDSILKGWGEGTTPVTPAGVVGGW